MVPSGAGRVVPWSATTVNYDTFDADRAVLKLVLQPATTLHYGTFDVRLRTCLRIPCLTSDVRSETTLN